MQKNRNMKVIMLVALCFVVIGISIAYATMSTTLTIKGSAVMETESWKIKFENLALDSSGAGSFTTQPKIVDEVLIESFVAKLTKPGDKVIIKFDVTNAGSLDAYVGSSVLGALTCTSAAQTPVTADAELVCNNLTYTLKYTNATTALQTEEVIAAGTAVAANQKLLAGKTVNMTLELEYNGNSLPSDNVSIAIGDTTIVYKQA